ncbi:alkaline phosphatase family protein [Nocardia sp. NPDC004711]
MKVEEMNRTEGAVSAPPITVIAVLDGLRPAALSATATPFLSRMVMEGCSYERAVAAFPALTRANAATLATGCLPGRHGILGNHLWHHELGWIDTSDVEDLRRMRGAGAMPQASIAERLTRSGHSTVVVGNGSPGCTYLLNPGSDAGYGARIASVGPDSETYTSIPQKFMAALAGLGPRPASDDEALEWAVAAAVATIRTDAPDLLIFWSGQPDTAHHASGLTSMTSATAIRRVDQAVQRLHTAALDTGRECNLIVTADHGFCATIESLELTDTMNHVAEGAGLSAEQLVTTFNGGAVFGYFAPETAPSQRTHVASQLAEQLWAGPVFCDDAYCPDNAFPVSLAVDGVSPFTPDLIITMRAESHNHIQATEPEARALHARPDGTAAVSGVHGTVHPADMHIPLILHGPAFAPRTRRTAPAGPADIAATVYKLITGTALEDIDGRILTESLCGVADDQTHPVEQTIQRCGAAITVSRIESRTYLLGGSPDERMSTQRESLAEHDRSAAAPSGPTDSGNEE